MTHNNHIYIYTRTYIYVDAYKSLAYCMHILQMSCLFRFVNIYIARQSNLGNRAIQHTENTMYVFLCAFLCLGHVNRLLNFGQTIPAMLHLGQVFPTIMENKTFMFMFSISCLSTCYSNLVRTIRPYG